MGTRIVLVDPVGGGREIADTGQFVEFGEEVEIEDADVAAALLEQENVWARPTTKAAKKAEKEGA